MYGWDFGDGSGGLGDSVNHSFPFRDTLARYVITLIVSDGQGGLCPDYDTVWVLPGPQLEVIGDTIRTSGGIMDSVYTAQFQIIQSSGISPSDSFLWNFGDGTVILDTGLVQSHSYQQFGTYDLTVTIPGYPCASKTTQVYNYPTPISSFDLSNAVLCEGNMVYITNTSGMPTGTVEHYLIDWGDGQIQQVGDFDTLQHIYHAPMDSAIHGYTRTPIFQVLAAYGSDMSTTQMSVSALPQTSIWASDTTGCAPLTVSFDALGADSADAFYWEFGADSTSASSGQTSYTYTAPGIYEVWLEVTSSTASCSYLTSTSIVVHGGPDTIGIYNPIADGCGTFMTQFEGIIDSTLEDSSNWFWNFGNGQFSYQRIPDSVMFEQSPMRDTSYLISATVELGCFVETIYDTVTVRFVPRAIDPEPNPCEPDTIPLNRPDDGSGFWSWEGEHVQFDGTLGHEIMLVDSAGLGEHRIYRIYQDSAYFCPTVKDSLNLTILPTFEDVSMTIGGVLQCDGVYDVGISLDPQFISSTSIGWDFGNGVSSVLATPPSIVYPQNNLDQFYTISVTLSNECTSVMITDSVLVGGIPEPIANASLCEGETLMIPGLVTAPSLGTIAYDSAQQMSLIVGSMSGSYPAYREYLHQATGCSYTDTFTIHILTSPSSDFTDTMIANVMYFQAIDSSAGMQYLWNFGDGTTATGFAVAHTYPVDGSYQVSLIVSNPAGCTSTHTQIIDSHSPSPPGAALRVNVFLPNTISNGYDIKLTIFLKEDGQIQYLPVRSITKLISLPFPIEFIFDSLEDNSIYILKGEFINRGEKLAPTWYGAGIDVCLATEIIPSFTSEVSMTMDPVSPNHNQEGICKWNSSVATFPLADIFLYRVDSDELFSYTQAEEDGHYSFKNLDYGYYRVECKQINKVCQDTVIEIHSDNCISFSQTTGELEEEKREEEISSVYVDETGEILTYRGIPDINYPILLILYSMDGKEVLRHEIPLGQMEDKIPLPPQNISSGIYFVQIQHSKTRQALENIHIWIR